MFPLRDDQPSSTRPVVVYALILLNVLAFLYEVSLGRLGLQRLVMDLGVVPRHFAGADPAGASVDLVTAMFLHGGWLHLIANMWYLWVFGDNVEDRMGHGRFLGFYLLGGIAASGLHIMLNWGASSPSSGARGAIAAVLGAYLVMFPHARILTLVPLFFLFVTYLPAIIVLGAWFALQVVSGVGSLGVRAAGAGVAYWAHIGGFVFGLLAVHLFAQRTRTLRPRVLPRETWWPT